MRYTDEYLNYWAGIYYRNGLLDLKLSFATFIKDPWRWVAIFGLPEPDVSKLKGIKPPRKQKVTPLIRTGGWHRAPPRRRVEIDVVIAPMDGKVISFEQARQAAMVNDAFDSS